MLQEILLFLMRIFIFILFLSLPAATAGAGGRLHVVTSLDAIEASEYIAAFEDESGVDVQWIRLSAGEALARLKAEGDRPTQEVWFGAPAAELAAAANAGLLERFKSAAASKIPLKWRDPDGYWIGIYFGAIAFVCGGGIKPPTSWRELLEPRYRGEISVSYPYTAGTGFTILSDLVAIMGEEGALAYAERLDRNVRRYTKSGSAPIMDVGLGEAGVGIAFDQDALRKGVARGLDLEISYPKDGVPYEIGGVAMVRGAGRELAARFIDWAVSPSAQGLMQKFFRVPLAPGAAANLASRRPETLRLARMDPRGAGEKREELILRWRERVGR